MTEAVPVDDHLILDADLLAHPHEFYRMLREQRPVVRIIVPSGIRAWLITRHHDVQAALADPRLAKNSASVVRLMERHTDPDRFHAAAKSAAHHMLNADPPEHTRLRRLVNRAFMTDFVTWYNHAHRHSGIGLHTPAEVHYGRHHTVRAGREDTLTAARTAHPERFGTIRLLPKILDLPEQVWINKPEPQKQAA